MDTVEGGEHLRFNFTVHKETVQHARQEREFLETGAISLSAPTYDILSWMAAALQPVTSGVRTSDTQQEAAMRVRT